MKRKLMDTTAIPNPEKIRTKNKFVVDDIGVHWEGGLEGSSCGEEDYVEFDPKKTKAELVKDFEKLLDELGY